MKIGIPVAEFHRGNTSEYVLRAFTQLGIPAEILNLEQFLSSLRERSHDYLLCVDSGVVFDLQSPLFSGLPLDRIGYWFIDYRHHWDGQTRSPGDLAVAKELTSRGGWVFQSQLEDCEHLKAAGVTRCSWLPLGADLDVWSDSPREEKRFDIAFVGNVWDRGRAEALQLLLNASDLKVGFFGHGSLWKEDGAKLLRSSKIGFNISSYFGSPHAFDVNMRVFETLSCGVPLLTNEVPGLWRIFPKDAAYIRTYRETGQIVSLVRELLQDQVFLSAGGEGRAFVAQHATYRARMERVLATISQIVA